MSYCRYNQELIKLKLQEHIGHFREAVELAEAIHDEKKNPVNDCAEVRYRLGKDDIGVRNAMVNAAWLLAAFTPGLVKYSSGEQESTSNAQPQILTRLRTYCLTVQETPTDKPDSSRLLEMNIPIPIDALMSTPEDPWKETVTRTRPLGSPPNAQQPVERSPQLNMHLFSGDL